MLKKSLLLAVLLIFFPIFAIYAQEENSAEDATETEEIDSKPLSVRPDFWISLGGDIALYDSSKLYYGGSFAFGYGSGASMGLKATYFFDKDFNLLEIDLLLRLYLSGRNAYWGPFVQLVGGASFINYKNDFAIPSSIGVINAGLGFGWRFVYFNRFFVEPLLRWGYPYFLGFGVSAGIRF